MTTKLKHHGWTCPACKRNSGQQTSGRCKHCQRWSRVDPDGTVVCHKEICCNCGFADHRYIARHDKCKTCDTNNALDDWPDFSLEPGHYKRRKAVPTKTH